LWPLPGADDPRRVQFRAVWSPEGRYLVFARAEAMDPTPEGAPAARRANDPNKRRFFLSGLIPHASVRMGGVAGLLGHVSGLHPELRVGRIPASGYCAKSPSPLWAGFNLCYV